MAWPALLPFIRPRAAIAAPSTAVVEWGNRACAIDAAMTSVRTTGEDCSVTTTNQAGARNRTLDAAEAAPTTSATSRVAARVPRTRARELATPSWNSCQAGSLSSIGRASRMPRWWWSHASAASTCGAKLVAGGSATSAGRTQAGSLLAAMPVQPGSRQRSCCCSRKLVKTLVASGESQELAVAMHDLADQLQRLGETLAVRLGHGHAPRHRIEAELPLEAVRERRIAEIGREEAVILRREEAGLVLQPLRQFAGVVEQQQPRAVRDKLGVGVIADGDADGATCRSFQSRTMVSRGPTMIVSDR